jgi:hypothetical protein
MVDPICIRLTLELTCGDEPISGRLRHPDGTTRDFVGWLELAQMLDEPRRRSAPLSEDTAEGRTVKGGEPDPSG